MKNDIPIGTLKIIIKNGTPIGTFKINGEVFNGNFAMTELVRLPIILYNLKIWDYYDFDSNTLLVKMQGSIISMLQFKKYFEFNYPSAVIK